MTATWLTPQDSEYAQASVPWNVSVQQHAAAVVVADTADDVVDAVQKARAAGLRVAVQGTGHGATARNDLSSTVLVRTANLNEVKVDPEARRARVGAGAMWQQVAEAAEPHGLAGLAGSSGGVGVVGYSLGGGLGWLARKYGLAASRIVAADVVLADGTQVSVDSDHEPDLLWSLRGGGGSCGAVTALEIELVPVSQTYAGTLFYPIERASEILSAYSSWVEGLPDEVTSTARVVNIPPIPQAPEPLRGKSFTLVQAVCLFDENQGAGVLEPLRALAPLMDNFSTLAPTALGTIHMDPPEPAPADIEGWLLNEFGATQAKTMVDYGGSGSPLVATQVRHLGGAVASPAPGGGAVDSLAEPFAFYGVGIVPEPAAAQAVRDQLNRMGAALGTAVSDRRFPNLSEHCDRAALYSPEAYKKLQAIRNHYDPNHTFVCVHGVD